MPITNATYTKAISAILAGLCLISLTPVGYGAYAEADPDAQDLVAEQSTSTTDSSQVPSSINGTAIPEEVQSTVRNAVEASQTPADISYGQTSQTPIEIEVAKPQEEGLPPSTEQMKAARDKYDAEQRMNFILTVCVPIVLVVAAGLTIFAVFKTKKKAAVANSTSTSMPASMPIYSSGMKIRPSTTATQNSTPAGADES